MYIIEIFLWNGEKIPDEYEKSPPCPMQNKFKKKFMLDFKVKVKYACLFYELK